MYYTYMIRCNDNSIYTGITTNLERRINEHISKNEKCAKYTLTHTAKRLEAAWTSENRVLASKLEYKIKKLAKKDKEELIKNNDKFNELFAEKLECNLYKKINFDS